MNNLENAKPGGHVAIGQEQSRIRNIAGADVEWRLMEIAAVTPTQITVIAKKNEAPIRIRKKDGLILGDNLSSRGFRLFAQLATPQMIKDTQDADRLRRQALAALQRIHAVADNLARYRIYASGTPEPDGVTLDQAERILAVIEGILNPPTQSEADKIESDQEQEHFLALAFPFLDFSSEDLATSVRHASHAVAIQRFDLGPGGIIHFGTTGIPVPRALLRRLEAAGMVGVEGTAQHVYVKLTSAGAQWMKTQRGERDAEEEQAGSNQPRPAG